MEFSPDPSLVIRNESFFLLLNKALAFHQVGIADVLMSNSSLDVRVNRLFPISYNIFQRAAFTTAFEMYYYEHEGNTDQSRLHSTTQARPPIIH